MTKRHITTLLLLAATVLTVLGLVAQPRANADAARRLPACTKVWQVGRVLPEHYTRCKDTGPGALVIRAGERFYYTNLTTGQQMHARLGHVIRRG